MRRNEIEMESLGLTLLQSLRKNTNVWLNCPFKDIIIISWSPLRWQLEIIPQNHDFLRIKLKLIFISQHFDFFSKILKIPTFSDKFRNFLTFSKKHRTFFSYPLFLNPVTFHTEVKEYTIGADFWTIRLQPRCLQTGPSCKHPLIKCHVNNLMVTLYIYF